MQRNARRRKQRTNAPLIRAFGCKRVQADASSLPPLSRLSGAIREQRGAVSGAGFVESRAAVSKDRYGHLTPRNEQEAAGTLDAYLEAAQAEPQ